MKSGKGMLEAALFKGRRRFIGVDEVGRGCLAGPVVAGAAALNWPALQRMTEKDRGLIRDSKKLSARQRQKALTLIRHAAGELSTGSASVEEIETLGIRDATFLAMHRALGACTDRYHTILVDGRQTIPDRVEAQQALVGGDSLCYSIAAASILAKEFRDQLMRRQAEHWPHWGFDQNVGYGTRQHLDALQRHGPCPLHRRNFSPISSMQER